MSVPSLNLGRLSFGVAGPFFGWSHRSETILALQRWINCRRVSAPGRPPVSAPAVLRPLARRSFGEPGIFCPACWRKAVEASAAAPKLPSLWSMWGRTMPFSSLKDPSDLARAYAVMDAAWDDLKDGIPEEQRDSERTRLAYLVASLAPLALDEAVLKQNVLDQFRQRASQASAA